MQYSPDIMPIWLQTISKIIFGALLGASVGLVLGGEAGYLTFKTPQPLYDKALGSDGFQLIGLTLTIVASMITGGCMGFVVGAIVALTLHVRTAHRASQLQ